MIGNINKIQHETHTMEYGCGDNANYQFSGDGINLFKNMQNAHECYVLSKTVDNKKKWQHACNELAYFFRQEPIKVR